MLPLSTESLPLPRTSSVSEGKDLTPLPVVARKSYIGVLASCATVAILVTLLLVVFATQRAHSPSGKRTEEFFTGPPNGDPVACYALNGQPRKACLLLTCAGLFREPLEDEHRDTLEDHDLDVLCPRPASLLKRVNDKAVLQQNSSDGYACSLTDTDCVILSCSPDVPVWDPKIVALGRGLRYLASYDVSEMLRARWWPGTPLSQATTRATEAPMHSTPHQKAQWWSLLPVAPRALLDARAIQCWKSQLQAMAAFLDPEDRADGQGGTWLLQRRSNNTWSAAVLPKGQEHCQEHKEGGVSQQERRRPGVLHQAPVQCTVLKELLPPPDIVANVSTAPRHPLRSRKCFPWETLVENDAAKMKNDTRAPTTPQHHCVNVQGTCDVTTSYRRNVEQRFDAGRGRGTTLSHGAARFLSETLCQQDDACDPEATTGRCSTNIKKQCQVRTPSPCLAEFHQFQRVWDLTVTQPVVSGDRDAIRDATANFVCCLQALRRVFEDFQHGFQELWSFPPASTGVDRPHVRRQPFSKHSQPFPMCRRRLYSDVSWWLMTQAGVRSDNSEGSRTGHQTGSHSNGNRQGVLHHEAERLALRPERVVTLTFHYAPPGGSATTFPQRLLTGLGQSGFVEKGQFLLRVLLAEAFHLSVSDIRLGAIQATDLQGHPKPLHDWETALAEPAYFHLNLHIQAMSSIDPQHLIAYFATLTRQVQSANGHRLLEDMLKAFEFVTVTA